MKPRSGYRREETENKGKKTKKKKLRNGGEF